MNTTVKLNNGRKVIGKEDGTAKTYSNRKAAMKVAQEVHGSVYQSPFSRVFFVEVTD